MVNTVAENATMVAALARYYPNLTIPQIIGLMQMPGIDKDTAIWCAIDLGMLKIESDKFIPVGEWNEAELLLSQDIMGIQSKIMFLLVYLNKDEIDIEEHDLNHRTAGYLTHDYLVAINNLLGSGKVSVYTINDVDENGQDNEYTFYTLPENINHKWGKKQFKRTSSLKIDKNRTH